MNIHSSLIAELRDKSYRDAYVASRIKIGLPFQARALRKSRGWSQEQLAEQVGMSQPRIAEIEKPSKRRFNLETLLRIAAAFDVGLEVSFVPIGQIIRNEDAFDPDEFSLAPFTEELREAEEKERSNRAEDCESAMNTPEEIRHWDEKQAERIEALEAEITHLQQEKAELHAELTGNMSEMFKSIPACYDTPVDHFREMARRFCESRDELKHSKRELESTLRDLLTAWREPRQSTIDAIRISSTVRKECADQLAQCLGDPQ